jgi:hypothetical protein
MDRATVACFLFHLHLRLSQIVGMEAFWEQVMMDLKAVFVTHISVQKAYGRFGLLGFKTSIMYYSE